VAISMKKPTVGRQIKENDVLYVYISEEEVTELKKRSGLLSADEEEVLEELLEIRRKRKSSLDQMGKGSLGAEFKPVQDM